MLALIHSFNLLVHKNPKPLHLLITSGAGFGKYHLIHTLKKFLEKNLTDYVGLAQKLKVLLLASTRMSAIDINDTTIHSDLNKPINYRSRNLPKLSNSKR